MTITSITPPPPPVNNSPLRLQDPSHYPALSNPPKKRCSLRTSPSTLPCHRKRHPCLGSDSQVPPSPNHASIPGWSDFGERYITDICPFAVCQTLTTSESKGVPSGADYTLDDIVTYAYESPRDSRFYGGEPGDRNGASSPSSADPNIYQRQSANARERSRTFHVNAAFNALRTLIPTKPPNRKLSKIETLHLAISYISHLGSLLEGGNQDSGTTDGDRTLLTRQSSFPTCQSYTPLFERDDQLNFVFHDSYILPQDTNSSLNTTVIGNNSNVLSSEIKSLEGNRVWNKNSQSQLPSTTTTSVPNNAPDSKYCTFCVFHSSTSADG